jgi:hypothetical protein
MLKQLLKRRVRAEKEQKVMRSESFPDFVVGRCRSGSIIKVSSNTNLLPLEAFTPQDLFDAYAVYSFLAVRFLRQGHQNLSEVVSRLLTTTYQLLNQQSDYDQVATEAGVQDAFSLRAHGLQLVSIEFRE